MKLSLSTFLIRCLFGQFDKALCEAACPTVDAAGEPTCWKNATFNFDNVVNAGLLIFFVALGDWGSPMLVAVDSRGEDENYEKNSNVLSAIFFIMVMFVFYFFLFNLWLGVLQDIYTRLYAQEQGIEAGLKSREEDFDGRTLDLILAAESQSLKIEKQRIARKVALVEAHNTGKQKAAVKTQVLVEADVTPPPTPTSSVSPTPFISQKSEKGWFRGKAGSKAGSGMGQGSGSGFGTGSGSAVNEPDSEHIVAVKTHNAEVRNKELRKAQNSIGGRRQSVSVTELLDRSAGIKVDPKETETSAAAKIHNAKIRRQSQAAAYGIDLGASGDLAREILGEDMAAGALEHLEGLFA